MVCSLCLPLDSCDCNPLFSKLSNLQHRFQNALIFLEPTAHPRLALADVRMCRRLVRARLHLLCGMRKKENGVRLQAKGNVGRASRNR